jgi:octopine/nopaline transport system permease protein
MTDLWTLFIDQGWAMALIKGCGITMVAAVLGTMVGVVFGFPMAIARWRKVPVLSPLIAFYSGLVRGVPGLLVIYLIFFGTIESVDSILTFLRFGTEGNTVPFIMGVLAVGVISCSYAIEVFRAALQALPRGLIEAAAATGMSDLTALRRIIIPLALRNAIGGLNNAWQMTVKDTSLVSVVGLQEMMRTAAIAAGITRSSLIFYLAAALLYLLITLVSQWTFRRAEQALNLGFGGRR